jgi:hypothetical protein
LLCYVVILRELQWRVDIIMIKNESLLNKKKKKMKICSMASNNKQKHSLCIKKKEMAQKYTQMKLFQFFYDE